MAQEEGVWLQTGFVRSGSERTDSRSLAEPVVCNGPRVEVCRSRTRLLEKVFLAILLRRNGKLLCRCQGLTCDKDQRRLHVDLVPGVPPSEHGYGHTTDVCAESGLNVTAEADRIDT